MPVSCRNLETHSFQRDRAIALPLTPPGLQAKRVTQRFACRTRTQDIGGFGKALDWRASGLAVHGAVVLNFHPGLGCFIEQFQGQVRNPVEHLHQPTLECAPERLLLPILIWAVRESLLVDDAQAQEPFGDFLGHHRCTVVGQERARQTAFLDRLGQSVHQILRRLRQVPLNVATQSRMVIEDA